MASGAGSVTTRSFLTTDLEAYAVETAAARGELEEKGISTEGFSDLDVRIYSMCVSCFGLSSTLGADVAVKALGDLVSTNAIAEASLRKVARISGEQIQKTSVLLKIMQIFKAEFPSEEGVNFHFAYMRHPLSQPFYNASKIQSFTDRLNVLVQAEIIPAVEAELRKSGAAAVAMIEHRFTVPYTDVKPA